MEAAKGWSKVLSDHWSANKAAADKRWKQRQDALLHSATDTSAEQQQTDDDVDWRHKHVHADWRNLLPEQQANGTAPEPADWRHMEVHPDWRNLMPHANASADAAADPTAAADPAAAAEGGAEGGAEGDAADGAPAEEEEEDAEAVAGSLAERREELRRGTRHQHAKDVKSHRSGLTGNLHTHQH